MLSLTVISSTLMAQAPGAEVLPGTSAGTTYVPISKATRDVQMLERASRSKIPESTTTTSSTTTPPPPPPPPSSATIDQPKQRSKPASAPKPTNAPSSPAPTGGDIESYLLQSLNNERAARGLAPLQIDGTLTQLAETWSGNMAKSGKLRHSGTGPPGRGVLSGFDAFAENVLQASGGTTAGGMHQMWMSSSTHRLNMLQPGFDVVGIGAVCEGGSVYVTETFGRRSGTAGRLSKTIPDPTPLAPAAGGPSCGG